MSIENIGCLKLKTMCEDLMYCVTPKNTFYSRENLAHILNVCVFKCGRKGVIKIELKCRATLYTECNGSMFLSA